MSETMARPGELIIDDNVRALTESLLAKVGQAREQNERMAVIEYGQLEDFLSTAEVGLIDQVYALNPRRYGFKGPKLALELVPDQLVRIAPQPYNVHNEQRHTKPQFVPEPAYAAYEQLASDMQRQLDQQQPAESSYRSPAYQAITFLSILKLYDYDVAKTASRAAIPGYSEHGTPSRLAFDFQSSGSLPSDETPQDFADTPEYEWLTGHARRFGFTLSYLKDNPYGLMFEPWHWRHDPALAI